MPNNAGLLMNLLGSFIGDQSPQKNPKYLDENGNPIEGESPYIQPGFGTKFFHPDVAAQAGQLNLQPYQARVANATTNQVAAGNLAKVRPVQGLSLTDPNVSDLQAGLLTGGRADAGAMYEVNQRAAMEAKKIPELTANHTEAELREGTRKAIANLSSGVPERESAAQGASADYSKIFSEAQGRLTPPRSALELGKIGQEQKLLAPEFENKLLGLKVDTAQRARTLAAKESLDNLYKLGIANETWQGAHPPVAASPFYRGPAGKPAEDPSYIDMVSAMKAKLAMGKKAPIPVGKSGLNIIPPIEGSTTNRPTISTLTNTHQDAIQKLAVLPPSHEKDLAIQYHLRELEKQQEQNKSKETGTSLGAQRLMHLLGR